MNDLMNDLLETSLDWLASPNWGPVPYGKYIFAFLVIWLLSFAFVRIMRVARLYFLAKFTSKGRVTKVLSNVDGDTVKVEHATIKGKKASIRMIGVDTPESLRSLYMDVAPFGKVASDYTKKRLPPGTKLLLIYDIEHLDKFGRELVYVYLMSGELYNATLIKKGYAFSAEFKPNLRYAKLFKKLENKAKAKGKRLWEVYEAKGELSKKYKRTNEYRRFKYEQDKKKKK